MSFTEIKMNNYKKLTAMKNLAISYRIFVGLCILTGMIFFLTACDKEMEGQIYRVYDDKMLDEIMEEQQLTGFLSVVEKAGMTGTIHAYGTYTFFSPTNDALDDYLESIGKNDANALTKDEAASIVKYHLILDTLATTDFVDGRMASPNFAKKYLTTKAEADGDLIYQRINRQAKVITENLRGANGILHIIDQVLTPPENSITDAIRALPDEFSLMKSLFEESGWADSLDVEIEDNWFTFFIQSNEAFESAGIKTKEDLLEQLAVSTPAVAAESLIPNFIAYHAVNSLMYIVDLLSASSMQTLVPRQVITLKRNQDEILLNELIQDKINEPGIPLIRTTEYADLSCSNGVIQQINGHIEVKNRQAYRVYWDIAEQPELLAMKNFRKPGAAASFAAGELSEIQWGGKAPGTIDYWCSTYPTVASFNAKGQYVYNDALRFGLNTGTTQWMEFTLPVLIEGKYKVWLCYRRELEATIKTIFKQEGYDDQVLPYLFSLAEYGVNGDSEGWTPELAEMAGWKTYTAKTFNSVMNCHVLGIIDVQTTGRHILRFEAQPGGRGQSWGSTDMIQFIPIDEDQLWPRVDMKGNWFYQNMPACEAWPYDCVEEGTE